MRFRALCLKNVISAHAPVQLFIHETMSSSLKRVARILNSTSASFFTGLSASDQTSLLDVLEDYFFDTDSKTTGIAYKYDTYRGVIKMFS